MIRRSPTRIELKLEDLQEFDFIAKYDKKKAPVSANDSKVLRHERLGFRPKNSSSGNPGTSARILFQADTLAPSSRIQVTPTHDAETTEGAEAPSRTTPPPESRVPVANLINIEESISSPSSYATPTGPGQDLMTMSIEEDIVRDDD